MTIIPKSPAALECSIDQVNWSEEYPYKPEVKCRLSHDSKWLFLEYEVNEKATKAEESRLGEAVYEDSCVEFFIKPEGGRYYYNFEFNAIGCMSLARRLTRDEKVSAPMDVLRSVKCESSLGSAPFAEKTLGQSWTLKVDIPIGALYESGLTTWDGLECSINLYKCGDGLSEPHFLSWAPISHPTPNFHLPEFFRKVRME